MSRFRKVLLGVAAALVALLVVFGYGVLNIMGVIQTGPYEHEAPSIPELQRPAVLVLSKANGFVHEEALPAGEAMLRELAREHNWSIYTTDNAATHNPQDLARFDVVVWNNVSGDVLTEEQRAALRAWIEQGGGWVGIHASGGDLHYKWDWYRDTLIGAQFVGHTMDPQFQDAVVHVADDSLQVTSGLPSAWNVPSEEWYAFDQSPRDKGYEILLTLDESSYVTRGKTLLWQDRMEGEHPIAWRHSPGQGRALYIAIGHQAATYQLPQFQRLVGRAIEWAGRLSADRTPAGG